MKKLCNKCGSELDLSKRLCDNCGAFNPFFISSLKQQSFSSDKIEKRKLEELAVNHMRDTVGLEEKAPDSNFYSVPDKTEPDLKSEIQRIKQESELSTKEIREELRHIGEENRKLRDEIESISKNRLPVKEAEAAIIGVPVQHETKAEKKGTGLVIAIWTAVLLCGFVLGYFFLNKINEPQTAKASADVKKPAAVVNTEPAKLADAATTSEAAAGVTKDSIAEVVRESGAKAPAQDNKLIAAVSSAPVPAKKPKSVVKPSGSHPQPDKPVNKEEFILNEAKAKNDLVGRKLSGCGISVNKAAEVVSLQNLVMVEELPTGAMKYKCIAKIVQGGDTYTVTPYMYYNPDGVLINVDGTNCE
jgi:hypothetical protein